MDSNTQRQSALFSGSAPWDEFQAALAALPPPLSSDVIFELAQAGGWRPGDRVLDVGSYGFTHARRLAKSLGCHVVAVDLVAGGLRSDEKQASSAARVVGAQGDAQELPLLSGSLAGVWSRDMVTCVDPPRFLGECARVLRPDGIVVMYAACLTPLLAGAERERLVSALSLTDGADRSVLEKAIASAGFGVDRVVEVGGGWPETELAAGGLRFVDDLLAIARMVRAEEELVAQFGRSWFETMLAWRQWAPFMALGKLAVVIYVLRKEAEVGCGCGSAGI